MGMEGRTISDLFINEQIRDREVRVIGENGEQLGVMPTQDMLAVVHMRHLAPAKTQRNLHPVALGDKLPGGIHLRVQVVVAVVDKAPKVEGRSMTMFLAEKR